MVKVSYGIIMFFTKNQETGMQIYNFSCLQAVFYKKSTEVACILCLACYCMFCSVQSISDPNRLWGIR